MIDNAAVSGFKSPSKATKAIRQGNFTPASYAFDADPVKIAAAKKMISTVKNNVSCSYHAMLYDPATCAGID